MCTLSLEEISDESSEDAGERARMEGMADRKVGLLLESIKVQRREREEAMSVDERFALDRFKQKYTDHIGTLSAEPSALDVRQLRAELGRRGMITGGMHRHLAARLEQHFARATTSTRPAAAADESATRLPAAKNK